MPDALYVPDGDAFVPTEFTRGPWDPAAQHGGPPAALLARCIERVEPGAGLFVTRLTVELLRPVPVRATLAVSTRVSRPGSRVQLVEAHLTGDGVELARATALRIRPVPESVDDPAGATAAAPPPPEDCVESRVGFGFDMTTLVDAIEMRWAGGPRRRGPATVWLRLVRPLVEGEDPSPLSRVALAADFGNGVSSALDWSRFIFINPDLTLYLHRQLEGDWVCLDAMTWVRPGGGGFAESALHDRRGRLGRSLQGLVVDHRPEGSAVP